MERSARRARYSTVFCTSVWKLPLAPLWRTSSEQYANEAADTSSAVPSFGTGTPKAKSAFQSGSSEGTATSPVSLSSGGALAALDWPPPMCDSARSVACAADEPCRDLLCGAVLLL